MNRKSRTATCRSPEQTRPRLLTEYRAPAAAAYSHVATGLTRRAPLPPDQGSIPLVAPRSGQPGRPRREWSGQSAQTRGKDRQDHVRHEPDPPSDGETRANTVGDRPVHLHLFAGLGLKPDHRLDRLLWPQRCHEQLQHGVAAAIAALAQLHQQHTRRYPLRCRRVQPLGDVGPEWVELSRPRRARLVTRRPLVPQIAPDRVARDARFPRDLANAPAVPMQYPD